mmetsp:Transcript_70089/g.97449  ORF Transcript_70089/g.97449 Transcript_70089/m.97449 type:complete len:187 (-) Transcript_70089:306-866(-)
MAYILTIVGGRGLGTKFVVKPITTIGRERVDIVLDRGDTMISRLHAILEVTPSQGLIVLSDRSQHGTIVIRPDGERLRAHGRAVGPGDASGSVLVGVGDQIQLGGVTLEVEELTSDKLKDEEVEEEAAAVVAGFGHPMPPAGAGTAEAAVTAGSAGAPGAAAADAEGDPDGPGDDDADGEGAPRKP